MNRITKSNLKNLVSKGKTKTALEIIYHISEHIDNEIHKIACLNLYRYNNHVNEELSGIAKPETPQKITKNTLDLIDRLPNNNFENPLPKLTKEILKEQKSILKNVYLRYLLSFVLAILISCLVWFFYPQDPLNIVGDWHYTVTPKSGRKLSGIKDINKPLIQLYDSICGRVTIEPVYFNRTSYNMIGFRSEKYIEDIDVLERNVDLKFTEFSHDDDINNKCYFFRFEAQGDEKNKGFVRINHFPTHNNKLLKMSGEIYYLYNHNEVKQWETVDIIFNRE